MSKCHIVGNLMSRLIYSHYVDATVIVIGVKDGVSSNTYLSNVLTLLLMCISGRVKELHVHIISYMFIYMVVLPLSTITDTLSCCYWC